MWSFNGFVPKPHSLLFVKVRRMYHYAASEEEIARTLHLLCWTCSSHDQVLLEKEKLI